MYPSINQIGYIWVTQFISTTLKGVNQICRYLYVWMGMADWAGWVIELHAAIWRWESIVKKCVISTILPSCIRWMDLLYPQYFSLWIPMLGTKFYKFEDNLYPVFMIPNRVMNGCNTLHASIGLTIQTKSFCFPKDSKFQPFLNQYLIFEFISHGDSKSHQIPECWHFF